MQLIRKIYEMIPDVDALKTRVDAAADKLYCLLALV